MCRFHRVVWVLFQGTFQLVRLEALLEASKLTISFLKGLLVALCIFKLNRKQRLIKEWGYTYKFRRERVCSLVFHVNRKRVTN